MRFRLHPALCLLAALTTLTTGPLAGQLVLGVEDLPYLPYYTVERGQYLGYSRDLFDSFSAATGWQIQYRPLPVERLYRALLQGDIDAKFPDHPTWRSDLKAGHAFSYSHAIAPYVDGVMVPAARAAEPAGQFRRIGTMRGFTPWGLLPLVRQGQLTLSENNSLQGLLEQTLAGRVDGAYLNVAVARYQLRAGGRPEETLALASALPSVTADYQVSSLRRGDALQALDAWLDTHAPRVRELRRKWGIGD
jgi:polar amino acid transport system substrate-binding protein